MQERSSITSSSVISLSSGAMHQSIATMLTRDAAALAMVAQHVPPVVGELARIISETNHHVILTGIGKSGFIARKIAATFASTGTPAFFVHPAEAIHGDLGMITSKNMVIALSKSGRGEELEAMLAQLQSRGNTTVLLCCQQGMLAQKVNYVIQLPFETENNPLGLAPTTSAMIMLAVGDALALAVSEARGFSAHDFAQFHPGGSLGNRLLLRVRALMHGRDALPLLKPTASFQEVLLSITAKKLGVGVVECEEVLCGIITDGDLRRGCEAGSRVFDACAQDLMTPSPKTINPDMHAAEALKIMEDHHITSLVVVESSRVVGLLHIHDVIKTGIK